MECPEDTLFFSSETEADAGRETSSEP